MGSDNEFLQLPEVIGGAARHVGTLLTPAPERELTARDIRAALEHPLWKTGDRPLFDVVQPGESLCLVVSDHTRRTAVDRVLPVLLSALFDRGCRRADMRILVASGIHRHPNPAEIQRILGPDTAAMFAGSVFCHNPDDAANLVDVGTTRRGHRVRINRRAIECDRLILTGAATYHYHAGFGGGRKSLVPGLAARDTIAFNHSLTLDPHADRMHPAVEIGRMDGNPVAEEMLESARMCDPDGIVNTVLSPGGALAGVFAGDLDIAHRAACARVEAVSRVTVETPADFVVATAGTAGNWVQSHKALFNASRAVRPGGRIVLVAPCPEGLGDERFRYWIRKASLPEMYAELRGSTEVLGQTALSTRIRGERTILVTSLPPADARDLGIETAPDIASAVHRTLELLAVEGCRSPAYCLMPQAKDTVPFTAGRG